MTIDDVAQARGILKELEVEIHSLGRFSTPDQRLGVLWDRLSKFPAAVRDHAISVLLSAEIRRLVEVGR